MTEAEIDDLIRAIDAVKLYRRRVGHKKQALSLAAQDLEREQIHLLAVEAELAVLVNGISVRQKSRAGI